MLRMKFGWLKVSGQSLASEMWDNVRRRGSRILTFVCQAFSNLHTASSFNTLNISDEFWMCDPLSPFALILRLSVTAGFSPNHFWTSFNTYTLDVVWQYLVETCSLAHGRLIWKRFGKGKGFSHNSTIKEVITPRQNCDFLHFLHWNKTEPVISS